MNETDIEKLIFGYLSQVRYDSQKKEVRLTMHTSDDFNLSKQVIFHDVSNFSTTDGNINEAFDECSHQGIIGVQYFPNRLQTENDWNIFITCDDFEIAFWTSSLPKVLNS